MRVEHFMNFDTHGAVKRLIAVGLQDKIAEEVVTSIARGRDYDFSKLITKDEFFKYKQEVSEKFNLVDKRFDAIDKEIALIKQEIKAFRKEFKADIEASRKEARADNSALKSELKAEIDALRKEVEIGFARLSAEIANSKNDTLKWVVGLFIIQITSIVGFFVTILVKSYF